MEGVQRQRQAGFTLVEILVTIVVLSIGLLGIAGMQASSLRNNQAAYTKTQAANLAADMADRIRANPGASSGAYVYNTSGFAAPETSCITAGCAPDALASYDLYEWSIPLLGKTAAGDAAAQPVLPEAQGDIAQDGNDYVITLLWREPAFASGMERMQCVADQDPEFACFQLRVRP